MRYVKRSDAVILALAAGVMLSSLPPRALADPTNNGPNSPYFSESMLEKQNAEARAALPGGEWNNAKVNVPSYINTAVGPTLGMADPALDAVSAGVGVVAGGSAPAFNAAQTATQAALTVQSGAVSAVVGGSGGGGAGGFSAGGVATTATGAVLGAIKAIP